MESTDAHSWRIRPAVPVAKLIGAAAVISLAYAFDGYERAQLIAAGVVASVLVAWAARDLVAPVRLAADSDGLTVVSGLARRRHLPWSQIEQIRVDRRQRRGLRSELLEIDAGDTLLLLGAHELGAAPEEVAAQLTALRRTGGTPE